MSIAPSYRGPAVAIHRFPCSTPILAVDQSHYGGTDVEQPGISCCLTLHWHTNVESSRALSSLFSAVQAQSDLSANLWSQMSQSRRSGNEVSGELSARGWRRNSTWDLAEPRCFPCTSVFAFFQASRSSLVESLARAETWNQWV